MDRCQRPSGDPIVVKEKLVKVLVVALILSAFKSMLSLPIKDLNGMIYLCFCVLLLALSGVLIAIKVKPLQR